VRRQGCAAGTGRKFRPVMYSDCIVKSDGAPEAHQGSNRRAALRRFGCALLLATLAPLAALARESDNIHWSSVTQAQVKVDQTTPLTWGVYQAVGKKDKPDKKLSNLVLTLIGHRYLLIDLKHKQVYEVPLKQLHHQDDEIDSGDLLGSSRLVPTSDWVWSNVGPAELYKIRMGDYGRLLQLTLPHPYLIGLD
jgi:hypothetical protein